jgi:hypothetical protein
MMATQLTTRTLVRLAPLDPAEDVAAFLQGLVTNDVVMGALPCYAALLSPQGKHLFDFLVWRDKEQGGADLLLDCEAAHADELARRLAMYRLRRKIAIARDDALAVHWSPQERAGAVPDPRLPQLGWRWLGPPEGESADAAWLAHRLSQGVPEGRAELGDILWLETNAVELSGVSFTKGCYVGQENTARMNWRQKVNRRLVVVPLAASDAERRQAAYPDLGLAVDHLRVESLDPASLPPWQRAGVTAPET